uniref:Uncharacterized protein n=1 Tax=Rhizophora mucronata TaxID=61149 RepID=A0A2P2NQP6_RHIMU
MSFGMFHAADSRPLTAFYRLCKLKK